MLQTFTMPGYRVGLPLLWALPSVALLAALVAFTVATASRERMINLQDRVELASDAWAATAERLLRKTKACAHLFDAARRVPAHRRPAVRDVASSCSDFVPRRAWIVVAERRSDGAHRHIFDGSVGPDATNPVFAADHPALSKVNAAMDRARTTGKAVMFGMFEGMTSRTLVASTAAAIDGPGETYLSIRFRPNAVLAGFGLDLAVPGSFTALIAPDGRIVALRPTGDTLGDFVPPKLLELVAAEDGISVRNAPAWQGPVPRFDLAARRIGDAGYIIVAGAPSEPVLKLLLRRAELFALVLLALASVFGTTILLGRSVLSQAALIASDAEKAAAVESRQRQARIMDAIAHEVRSPIVRLIGSLEIAADAIDDTRVAIAEKSAQSVLQLVDDLLDVARLDKYEAGEATVGTVTDVADLVAEVVTEYSEEARHEGLTLTFSTSPPHICVVLDRVRVRQILANLVSNAVRCTISGGVTVDAMVRSAADGANSLVFTVADTGVGIPADLRDKVFDEFVSERPDGKARGTGLGLALVNRVVTSLGGTVTFGDRPGGGTIFDVVLPLEGQDVSTSATDSVKNLRHARILLADDEDVIRVATRRRLEKVGAIVTDARNGAEAVALCRVRRFDCVLMDFEMPELDGLDATRRIREGLGADAPPIFGLTSHLRAFKDGVALDAGMAAVFTKPVQLTVLAQMCRGSDKVYATEHGPSPKEDDAYLDIAVFTDVVGTGSDAAAHISGFEKASRCLDSTLSATETADTDALAKEVHRFKGVAMIFGAKRLTEKLEALEAALREPEPDDPARDVPAQVAGVRTCLAETIEAMRAAQTA